MRKLTSNHFKLFSNFKEDENLGYYMFPQKRYQYITDEPTGDKYLNDYTLIIRFKFLTIMPTLAFLGHALLGVVRLFYQLYQSIKNSYLFFTTGDSKYRDDLASSLTHLALIIPTLILLECVPVFGLLFPHNGRKLYANLETYISQSLDSPQLFPNIPGCILAPCMHPKPDSDDLNHFFGGSIYNASSF